MQHQFSAFIDDLKHTHGSNLASVTLYGSAAAGDFIPERSDYNILIALRKMSLFTFPQASNAQGTRKKALLTWLPGTI